MSLTFDDFHPQGPEIAALYEQILSGRLVHALLITGESGTGKKTLARLIARALLCRGAGRKPCGHCRDCSMSEKMEHPDLSIVSRSDSVIGASKERASIPVDEIREVIRICGLRTIDSGKRVALIFEADRMTPQAQNCLLKTLEEPPEETYFILVSDHAETLLSTILSRCRPVRLHPWPDETILHVLQAEQVSEARAKEVLPAANGSVGKALQLVKDESYWKLRDEVMRSFFGLTRRSEILKISSAWKDRKGEAEGVWQILELLIRQMLSCRLGEENQFLPPDLPEQWKRFANQAELKQFTALLDAVSEARKQTLASVNFQALLERLLLILMGESDQWRT